MYSFLLIISTLVPVAIIVDDNLPKEKIEVQETKFEKFNGTEELIKYLNYKD